jgi:hypothetical protein
VVVSVAGAMMVSPVGAAADGARGGHTRVVVVFVNVIVVHVVAPRAHERSVDD